MRLLVALMLAAAPTVAAAEAYVLPPETAALAPGPNLGVAMGNCGVCHSAEYITTQPRGLPNEQAFWQSEVVKMKSVYGAPLADADIPKIVEYLVATYSK